MLVLVTKTNGSNKMWHETMKIDLNGPLWGESTSHQWIIHWWLVDSPHKEPVRSILSLVDSPHKGPVRSILSYLWFIHWWLVVDSPHKGPVLSKIKRTADEEHYSHLHHCNQYCYWTFVQRIQLTGGFPAQGPVHYNTELAAMRFYYHDDVQSFQQ